MDASKEFVRVCVHNNAAGEDARLLKRFGEPSWNNPVVRFLDGDGKDIIPRVANDWSLRTLIRRMRAALEKSGKKVPAYLALLDKELTPKARETATFAYW